MSARNTGISNDHDLQSTATSLTIRTADFAFAVVFNIYSHTNFQFEDTLIVPRVDRYGAMPWSPYNRFFYRSAACWLLLTIGFLYSFAAFTYAN